jgi:hypothetical protein
VRVFILRGNVDCGCKERVGTIRALVQVDQHCRSVDNARKRESRDLCHRPWTMASFVQSIYAYSVVTLGEQQDGLRCQRSLRGRELGRAQAN